MIIPPFFGEFGVMVMEHLRYVHQHPAALKIVCCEPGMTGLFPSASEFFTDFVNPVEDENRIHRGPFKMRPEYWLAVDDIHRRVVAKYPGLPIDQPRYPSRHTLCRKVKFRPIANARVPAVDVVLAPRFRQAVPEKNWPCWLDVLSACRHAGWTVGVAGSRSTSVPLPADVVAWDHPDGATAGTIDLLAHCRLFIGSDTGPSHLAALMDTPQIVFGHWDETNPDCTVFMQIANRRFCQVVREGWASPSSVIAAAADYLG